MIEQVLPQKKVFKKSIIYQLLLHFAIILLLIAVLFPLYLLIIKSLKTVTQEQSNPFGFPNSIELSNYIFAWQNIKDFFINSIMISVILTAGLLVIASITAFAFVRFEFPFKEAIFIAMLSLMMTPGMLNIISQYAMIVEFNMINNYFGIILPGIAGSIPFSVFLLRTFFRGVPKELFEAAEIDGAGSITVFIKIMIPLSMSILATLLIITFLNSWNDYLWTKLVINKYEYMTIPLGLVTWSQDYFNNTNSWGPPFAAYVLSSLPLIIIFAFTSKQFIAGLTSGAFKM